MESNFDYIVIGAGSAGCVMSNRLSEGGKDTVLSIEAGGKDRNFFIHMPSGYSQIVPKKAVLTMGLKLNLSPLQITVLSTGQEVRFGEAHLQSMQWYT